MGLIYAALAGGIIGFLFTTLTGWGIYNWQYYTLCLPVCFLVGMYITKLVN